MRIIGSGGGKAGDTGGGISEAPDTLSSVAFARFVDLLGEGPIVGLVNGEFSIYLDGVPLRDLSGTANYRPFNWDMRTGTQSQTPIPGFSGTQQEIAVGLRFQQSQGKVIRSVPDAGAEAVRVTVAVQGLSQTTDKGEVNGTSVEYKIWCRVVAGSWVLAYNGAITGKATSRYQRSHEVPLANLGAGPYEVAVERITADSASALLVNNTYWDSYTIINYEQFAYPNSSLAAVQIDGRYFSSVPDRKYHLKGLIVRVPTNYDPIKRTYTGTWDGTWKTAYTNNPAWCYYDLVTHPRYGLGKRISDSQISKWVMYTIAQYCDGLVPTGLTTNVFDTLSSPSFSAGGGISAGVPVEQQNLEPRFTLNVVINTKDDAYKVLNNLASVFRGMTYWASGMVMLSQDRPGTASMIWTNANVIDGQFHYEGSSRSQRHTTVSVGWNDPTEDFKQKFEYVEDRAGILRYGVRSADVVAFGCTSRSQARRLGLWLLYTERMEGDAVKFNVGLDSANVLPGAIGQIMDRHRVGARWGGRVISATTTAVTLDAAVTLAAGAYTLSIMKRDGTIMQQAVNIATSGDYTVLNPAVAFAEAPALNFLWTLASTVVVPMLVRVVNVRPIDSSTYEITALQHEPSKYNAIEQGVAFERSNYTFLSYNKVAKVQNLAAIENSFKPTVTSPVTTNIEVGWDAATDPMVRGYIVKLSTGSAVRTLPEQTNVHATVQNAVVGTYTISVSAVNQLGIVGEAVSIPLVVTGIDTKPPADVTGLDYVVDSNGLRLLWVDVPDFIDYYEIREGGTGWADSSFIAQVKATSKDLGAVASGTHTYRVKAIDTAGNYSLNNATRVVTVGGALAPSVSYAIVGPDEVLSWPQPTSTFAIDGYEIREGATFGASTVVSTIKGTSFRRKVTFSGDKTYWVAAVDAAHNVGSYGSVSVTIAVPGTVTSSRVEVVDNNVLLYWAPPATGSLPVDRYEVRKGTSFAAGAVVGSNGNSTFAGVFEQQSGNYQYWVAAVDSAGTFGTAVLIPATVNQPPDYVLRTNIDSTFTGTLTNMYLDRGALVGPVDTSQTFATHFTSHAWTSPQDQITAGFPLYAEPSTTSGSYSEVFDFGTTLPSTTITATLGATVVDGSVTVSCQIAYKTLVGDAWTNATAGATSVLAAGFRYVQVTWTFTCTAGANLIRVTSFNLKLSAKLKTDSGTGSAVSTDTGGTAVNFNVSFIDVNGIVVTAGGTSPVIAMYDFTDVPNPTSFKVLLFDRATGARVSGPFSWTARGF